MSDLEKENDSLQDNNEGTTSETTSETISEENAGTANDIPAADTVAEKETSASQESASNGSDEVLAPKSKKTLYIVEACVAVVAIVFIVIALVNSKKSNTDSESQNALSQDSVSGSVASTDDSESSDATLTTIDNSALFDGKPDYTDISELNTLSLEECEAGVEDGSMLKLTTSSDIDVYVKNYNNAELFGEATTVSEDELDDYIYENFLTSFGEESTPDHEEAMLNDTVSINYVGKIDGVAFDGGTADDQQLLLGSGTYIPGFEEGVVGMKPGETKDIEVTFPEDYGSEEYAGKDAVFTVTLNEIVSTTTYPELSDELVQQAFDDKSTAEEAREYYRDLLLEEKIWQFIAENYYVSALSSDLVDEYYNETLEYYDQISQSYQTSISDLLSMYGEDLDSFKTDVMSSSCESSRYSLLYIALSEANNLSVTDEDIASLATEYGYDDVDAFLSDSGEQNVKDYLLQTKILEYLATLAK